MTRYRKDGRPWGAMWDAWRPAERQWLEAHAGTMPLPELAAALSAQFGTPRTPAAVRIRAKRWGISLWARGLGLMDMERLFGLDHRALVRWWVTPGLLPARRWTGRGPNAGWWFEPADVETFIREHSYAYDVARMQPGHRLTAIAQAVNRRDPWVTWDAVARYVGITTTNLDRWRRRGYVPIRRRPGAGGYGVMVVRASDLPAIRERIHAAQRQARATTYAKFVAMRRGQLAVAA